MHNESCSMFPVSCVNGCEQIVPRGQVRQFAIPVMYDRCAGAKIKREKEKKTWPTARQIHVQCSNN